MLNTLGPANPWKSSQRHGYSQEYILLGTTAPGQPCNSQDLQMNTLSDEMAEQQNRKHGKLYNNDLTSSKEQITKKQKKKKF